MNSTALELKYQELYTALLKAKNNDNVDCREALQLVRGTYGNYEYRRATKEENRTRVQNIEYRPKRKALNATERSRLYKGQRGFCSICQEPLINQLTDQPVTPAAYKNLFKRALLSLHVDHKNPNLSGDEFNARENLALAHPRCNESKGAKSIPQLAKERGQSYMDLV